MVLLSLLIALLLVSRQWVPAFVHERRVFRRYIVWFERQRRLRQWPVAVQYGACILPPVGLCWLIERLAPLMGLPWLPGAVAVVLLCSIMDFRRSANRLREVTRHWRRGEWHSFAAQRIDVPRPGAPADTVGNSLVTFWVLTTRGLFAPVMWLTIFGLGGLVFYVVGRTAGKHGHRARGDEPARAWRKVAFEFQQVLDACAARLVTFSVAVLRLDSRAVAVAVRRFRATDREVEGVVRMSMRVALGFGDWPEAPEAFAEEAVRRANRLLALRDQLVLLWMSLVSVGTLMAWAMG